MATTEPNVAGYVSGTWSLDPAHTEIGFVMRYLMVSKVRGHSRTYTGSITTADTLLDSHAEVEVDLSSITTGNDQRDGHLRSSDFFDVENNLTMTFRSTGVRQDGDTYLLDGDLTIRGVSRPITLEVELGASAPTPTVAPAPGSAPPRRSTGPDFGVSWNAAIEGGGVVVSDRVTINIEAEAVLEPLARQRHCSVRRKKRYQREGPGPAP